MSDKIAEDLAYLRDIAEAGEEAPSLSGRYTVMWSGLLTIALLIHFVVASGYIPGFSLKWIGLVWMVFSVLGWAGSFLISRSLQGRPGQSAAKNKVDRHTWRITGIGILLFAVSIAVVVFLRGSVSPVLFDVIIPTSFLAYAVTYSGTAAFSKAKSKWVPVILSLVMSVCTMMLIGIPAMYLVAALGVVAVMFLPGLAVLRNEPKLAE